LYHYTLCIFSGSERNRLSQAFAHLPKLWIAAENGCFIRPPLEGRHGQLVGLHSLPGVRLVTLDHTGCHQLNVCFDCKISDEKCQPYQLGATGGGKWITMVETSNLDWLESVQLVFDYFCERTPRSYVETRETSLVGLCKLNPVDP
jgi:trehalose 6-phosphate synthase/phosphatase